jgi:hypothetical protein
LGTGNPKGLYKITKSAKVTYNKESVISGGQQSHRCQEEFENTKGVIRIRISKKNIQHQWPNKKVQKDKQRSTKHTHKTKDRVTRTQLRTGCWFINM